MSPKLRNFLRQFAIRLTPANFYLAAVSFLALALLAAASILYVHDLDFTWTDAAVGANVPSEAWGKVEGFFAACLLFTVAGLACTVLGLRMKRLLPGDRQDLSQTLDSVHDDERQASEEALRLSEARYRNFIAQTSDAVIRYDFAHPVPTNMPPEEQIERFYESVVAECNDVAAQIYGHRNATKLIGLRYGELVDRRDPSNRALLREYIKAGNCLKDVLTEIKREGGASVHVLVSATGIIENGMHTRVWVTLKDITERVRNENVLRQNEQQLQLMSDSLPVLISYSGSNHRFTFANATYSEWFSIDHRSIPGRHMRDVFGRVVFQTIQPHFERALAGQPVHQELRLSLPGKKERFVDMHLTPHKSQDGGVLGIWALIADITQHKLTQQALQSSEETFRKAFRLSPDAIAITSFKDGNILEVNDGCVRMLQYDSKELIGKRPTDVGIYVNPDDRARFMQQVAEHGRAHDLECDLRKKDGTIISVLMSAERITLDELPCMLTNFRDITYLKHAERDLLRYEQIVSTITDAIIVINDQYVYEYANDHYLTFINKKKGEVVGKSMSEVLGKERLESMMPVLIRSFSGEAVAFELWRDMPDGRRVYMDIQAYRFRNPADGVWAVLSVGRDITERKRSDEIIRRNERKYRTLVEATGVIPWELDVTDWKVSYVGPQAVVTFGYRLSTWYDRQFWLRYVHPEDRERVLGFYRERAAANNRGEVEYRMMASSGEMIWIRDIISPTKDENGRPLLNGVMVDISEAVEREAELAQAQKMEAVGRLTGGVAHDFNNLLTIIRGNLNLLAEPLSAGHRTENQEIIADALSATSDAVELTDNLLAFSKRQSLSPMAASLNDLVEGSARLLRRVLGEDVEFKINLDQSIPVAVIDPYQFRNALINLAVNARDAMVAGGTLNISTGRKVFTSWTRGFVHNVDSGSYVAVSVSDTGAGMNSDSLKRACEPFFTTKETEKGSGLGLSMVYGFVKHSEGGMQIESKVGRGTVVTLYFPEGGHEKASNPNLNQEDKPREFSTGAETVLVTEDETRIRRYAARILRSLGYQVMEAADATEAMKILESNASIDMLFSDNVLPGQMNGRELADWAQSHRPNLKIILTTGFTQRREDEVSVYDGAFPFLKKPYSKDELGWLVRATFDAS